MAFKTGAAPREARATHLIQVINDQDFLWKRIESHLCSLQVRFNEKARVHLREILNEKHVYSDAQGREHNMRQYERWNSRAVRIQRAEVEAAMTAKQFEDAIYKSAARRMQEFWGMVTEAHGMQMEVET